MSLRIEYLVQPANPTAICWTYYLFPPPLDHVLEHALESARDCFAAVHKRFGARSFRIIDDLGALLAEEFWADESVSA
jgi:hypothetical protein